MNKPIHLNIPISKIDEEQRMVWGYATVEEIDKHSEIIGYEASKKAFAKWVGNIREMHGDKAVGKGIEVRFDDEQKGVWLGSYISKSTDGENAWIKVKEGILAGYSIGGQMHDFAMVKMKVGDEEKEILKVTDYDLSEVSLVDSPACPSAMLQVVKNSDKGGLQRIEKMEKGLGRPVAWWEKMYKFSSTQVIEPSVLIYNDNSMSKSAEIKKDVYDAGQLVCLAQMLAEYIYMESWEGEVMPSLIDALKAIKDAAAMELADDEVFPEPAAQAIELSMATLNLTKKDLEDKMAKKNEAKDIEKTVVGGEDRDSSAEVTATAEENGRPVNDTKERADEAGVPEVGAPVEVTTETEVEVKDEDGNVVTDKKTGEAKTETVTTTETVEQPPVKADELPSDEEGKKDVAANDDIQKANNNDDLTKSILAGVETLIDAKIAPLKEQVEKLSDDSGKPVAPKSKGSYMDVEKVDSANDANEHESRMDEINKRAEELAADPSLGTPQERIALGIEMRKLQRMNDPASAAKHAQVRASFRK